MVKSTDKEDLSICYIATVAAAAGISYDIKRHDADSTDGFLSQWITIDGERRFNSELRVQLKCTSSLSQYTDDGNVISYKLKSKNYNDLCAPSTSQAVLGLLVLPQDKEEWVKWTVEELMIKGCMYWVNLSGEDETTNSSTVTVKLNKKNVINSESLHKLLEKIAREEDL